MERLDEAAAAAAVQGTSWEVDRNALARTFEFADFAEAMTFVNRVAALAEERNHHPDIAISWNTVTLRQTSHSAGGITQADVDLVRAVDALTG